MENVLTEISPETAGRIGRRMIWLLLSALLLLSVGLVAIPVFLIQPFRPQTQRALEISYVFSIPEIATTALRFKPNAASYFSE